MLGKALYLVLAVCLSLPLGASEAKGRYTFKSYESERGLPEARFTAMCQDETGFIWVGTDTGDLIRYDGYRFQLAPPLPSILLPGVLCLLPAPGASLWVSLPGGLFLRKPDGSSIPVMDGIKPFVVASPSGLCKDANSTLWALRKEGGLYRQNGDVGMELLPGVPAGHGTDLAFNSITNAIYVAIGSGSLMERDHDGTWKTYTSKQGLPIGGIKHMGADGTGRLWILGKQSLHYLDPGEHRLHDASALLPYSDLEAGTFNTSLDGTLTIPIRAGLLRLRGDRHELIDASKGFSSYRPTTTLVDREGSLWVLGRSLYRVEGQGFVRGFTTQDGLPSDQIWSVFRDRLGRLWVGTNSGLALLGPEGFREIPGTRGLRVMALTMDQQDRLWIGSINSQPVCLEPGASSPTATPYRNLRWENKDEGPLPSRSTALLADRDGVLWLYDWTSCKVFRIDVAKGTIRCDEAPLEVSSSSGDGSLALDNEGRIWLGVNNTLVIRDSSGWHQFKVPNKSENQHLTSINPGGEGTCWVAFATGGISRIQYRNGSIRVVEHIDGFKGSDADYVYSAAPDKKGTLWFGTTTGVKGHRGGKVMLIGKGQGLVGVECDQSALMVDTTDDVWIGTVKGLVHLVAENEPKLPELLKVSLSEIHQGKTVVHLPSESLRPFKQGAGQLDIQFASATFVDEKAVTYQARLVGFEKEWRTMGTPEVHYPSLPAGRFSLEVRAAYPGMEFGPVASLPIEIQPTWWNTWWFRTLAALAVLGSIIGARKYRQAIQRAKSLKSQVDDAVAEVQKLSALLPLCAWCHQVRDDDGYWQRIESYLKENIGSDITHSICPDCAGKLKSESISRA